MTKAIISKATKLRKAIASKHLDISELQSDMEDKLASEHAELTELQSELSLLEQEAADAGMSVAELHEAVDAAMQEKAGK